MLFGYAQNSMKFGRVLHYLDFGGLHSLGPSRIWQHGFFKSRIDQIYLLCWCGLFGPNKTRLGFINLVAIPTK